MLFLVPAISQTHKSLENSQDFFVKTKTKTKTLGLKTKTKTKTLFFVLEAPRDQDFGLEDYITDLMLIFQSINFAFWKQNKMNSHASVRLSLTSMYADIDYIRSRQVSLSANKSINQSSRHPSISQQIDNRAVFLSFGAIELIHYRLMQKNRYYTVNSGLEVDCVRYSVVKYLNT